MSNEPKIGSERAKHTALYEMLSVQTTSDCHPMQFGHLQCNSSSFRYGDYDNCNDSNIVEVMNRSSLKAAIMPRNFCQRRISPEGIVHTRQDKDISMSPSMTERLMRRNAENGICNKDIHYPKSDKAGEPTGSKAERMIADWILSCAQRAHELSSARVREDLFQAEPCSRWLKRLGHSPSNVLVGVKRSKIGDGTSCDVTFSPLSKAVNYNASSSIKSVAEQSIVVDDDKNSHSDAERFPDVYWIGRWRHRCAKTTGQNDKHPNPAQRGLEYSEPKICEEKQIPSITAMALMAKVMKRTQKCVLQKSGSSTVRQRAYELVVSCFLHF